MARLSFLGAARTVTGSQYLLEAEGARVLIDCGMFQGDKTLRQRNWAEPPYDPRSIRALILTHTHIDHIGRVPRLVRQGFSGRIFATSATCALAEILLKDAAHLQEEDAEYLNRKGLTKHEPALPLFDVADAQRALERFQPVPLGERRDLEPFSFTFREAGHLLGAASVDLSVHETAGNVRILFSGDVGRFGTVLSRDPELAPEADFLLVESTYGNRTHATVPLMDQLETVLQRTFARGGVVLIPAFAVGRAQQLLFMMEQLVEQGRIRPFPVHIDSPMAIDATRIYERFGDAHGVPLKQLGGQSILLNKWVQVHRTREESKSLNALRGPAVILSSSGMLSGGRILHHCRVRLPHAENTVLITGHQGEGTLGRALIDGAKVVRIHKGDVNVLAEVTELRGLSGHADAGEILRWLSAIQTPPKRLFLTHGDEDAALALAARITEARGFRTHVPQRDETVDLAILGQASA